MLSSATWQHEINELKDLRFNWDDKLEVINGNFKLTKGPSREISKKLIIPKPNEVADQFEFLINTTAESQFKFFLNCSETTSEHYEKVSDFKKSFKILNKIIANIQNIFSKKQGCQSSELINRYNKLTEISSFFLYKISDYKAKLNKPPLESRPTKLITYDERTELTSIKATFPKRGCLKNTLEAANKALELSSPPLSPEFLNYVVTPICVCLSLTSVVKIVSWNILESLCCGSVQTRTPVRLAIDRHIENNVHLQAFQKYSQQILKCEIITEDVAKAFASLAPHSTTLVLKNAKLKDETSEINVYNPQIDHHCLKIVLEAARASDICNKIQISNSLLELDFVSEFLYKNNFELSDNNEYWKLYIRRPWI